jgi:signal peptidase I
MTVLQRLRKNPVVDLGITLVVAIGIAFIVQLWVVKPYRVPTASMESTVLIGDRVIAARFLYHLRDPQRGDIVVFHPNGTGNEAELSDSVADVTFVKRLIGLPNEVVGAVGGRTYVCGDGAPADRGRPEATPGCDYLDEPYLNDLSAFDLPTQEDWGPVEVPDGRYFMMGDNRNDSKDSRAWGSIRREQIIGRAFTTYWPLDRVSVY